MTISESTFFVSSSMPALADALPLAFELEGPRHDGDGQDAEALGDIRDDGRSTRARAPAHAGGDEQHVGAVDHARDAVAVFHRRVAPDLRPSTRAETPRERRAELQLRARRRALQCLRVGVGADEIDARQTSRNHVLDRIAAATAHADDLDDRAFFRRFVDDFKHDGSFRLSGFGSQESEVRGRKPRFLTLVVPFPLLPGITVARLSSFDRLVQPGLALARMCSARARSILDPILVPRP